jgi:mRNA interferase RelE/StbE
LRTEFRKSFVKDLQRLHDQSVRARVSQVILQVEQARSLSEISQLKKLRGSERYYRIQIGSYRVGVVIEGDTVIFVRVLPRKDIYRRFP